jgi:hypothetical protein
MVVILLNLWFVVPHFSDLTKVRDRKAKAQRALEMFEKEIARKPIYEEGIRKMQGQGQDIAAEDQIFHFQNAIQSEVVRTGVQIQQQPKPHSQTNQFFIEQFQSVNLQSKEQQLVDFLFGLGNNTALIRVRDLTLHADPSHTLLQAGIKLVASYQKKPTAKSALALPPAPVRSAPGEKKTTTTLRVNPNTAATNQGSAKPGVPPSRTPGMIDKKSTTPNNNKKP